MQTGQRRGSASNSYYLHLWYRCIIQLRCATSILERSIGSLLVLLALAALLQRLYDSTVQQMTQQQQQQSSSSTHVHALQDQFINGIVRHFQPVRDSTLLLSLFAFCALVLVILLALLLRSLCSDAQQAWQYTAVSVTSTNEFSSSHNNNNNKNGGNFILQLWRRARAMPQSALAMQRDLAMQHQKYQQQQQQLQLQQQQQMPTGRQLYASPPFTPSLSTLSEVSHELEHEEFEPLSPKRQQSQHCAVRVQPG